jgi:hypothetical protein
MISGYGLLELRQIDENRISLNFYVARRRLRSQPKCSSLLKIIYGKVPVKLMKLLQI